MAFIKAPYNFVPLNKIVITPEWAEYISQDIPFEDAQSGCLKITLTTHSPIFIKNGLPEDVEKNYFKWKEGKKEEQIKPFEFNQDATGRYFIPGSSLKGMIRNVLEVMSFGKLGNKVNDHRYSIRDLSPTAKDIYLANFRPADIFGGWLRKKGTTYILEDCGSPGRLSHRNLDEHYGTD